MDDYIFKAYFLCRSSWITRLFGTIRKFNQRIRAFLIETNDCIRSLSLKRIHDLCSNFWQMLKAIFLLLWAPDAYYLTFAVCLCCLLCICFASMTIWSNSKVLFYCFHILSCKRYQYVIEFFERCICEKIEGWIQQFNIDLSIFSDSFFHHILVLQILISGI